MKPIAMWASILLVFVVHIITGLAEPPTMLSPEENSSLAQMRVAGIQRDRTRIPVLLEALQKEDPRYQYTALHALAQLGAVEALPAIEALAQDTRDVRLRDYALAARARLQAESDTTSNAERKIARFLTELGMKKEDLRRVEPVHAEGVETVTRPASPPPKSQALRELADMVYRSHYATYKTSSQLMGVDFSADPGVVVKMRFALASNEQRAAKLIDTIAASKVYGLEGRYMVQLAIDEGLPASRAAAAKIREMDKNRDKYTFAGFRMLFDVLHGVGDKTQAPFINTFLHKPKSDFAWGIYADVAAGRKVQFVPGY